MRVTGLDKAIADACGETSGRQPKQTDTLIELTSRAELFHTADGTGYADLDVTGHRETWPIRQKGFRLWLTRAFFGATQRCAELRGPAVGAQTLWKPKRTSTPKNGTSTCAWPAWTTDFISTSPTPHGAPWRSLAPAGGLWDRPPVRFRRAAGMQPLPTPDPGGSIELLRPYLNVQTDAEFVLVVSWMLAVLRPDGPYPVLVLSGEQGSAKSTFSKILPRPP